MLFSLILRRTYDVEAEMVERVERSRKRERFGRSRVRERVGERVRRRRVRVVLPVDEQTNSHPTLDGGAPQCVVQYRPEATSTSTISSVCAPT